MDILDFFLSAVVAAACGSLLVVYCIVICEQYGIMIWPKSV